MTTELKQAAQQAVDAFDAFGDADDFASLFELTRKMRALRTAIQQAEAQQPAVGERLMGQVSLPDGSAFAIASFPLPKAHWLYAPREYATGAGEPLELPTPILTHGQREAVVAAIRYAVRGATMCGREQDFDPDAMVQNAVYALCGPYARVSAENTQTSVNLTLSQQPATGEPVGFIVSAVLIKKTPDGFNTQNKLYAVEAASREEAHGKVLPQLGVDFPEHHLHTFCSHPAPSVPDGYALVPTEPTQEMLLAYTGGVVTNAGFRWCRHQWSAMLAAAPHPQQPKELS